MLSATYIALIPLLPLASFLLIGLLGKRYLKMASGPIGTLSLLLSCALACITAFQYFFQAGRVNGVFEKITVFKFAWLNFSPNVSIDMGLVLDPISVMMILVVTLIALMVHIYSLSYMKGEERVSTYFSFLSLFTFSMLGLVLASNIFQMYIFWELVGLSSYLLIGFYFDKPSAVAAAKKAFIVTRFADLGFLIGILILSFHAETLDFTTLISRLSTPGSPWLLSISSASFMGFSLLTWGLVLLFVGGAGKSAMFPLHIWLPDAMEGPTPVSALIHAATMVVAGVFMVARMFPVYALSCPAALQVVAWTGAISSLFAALIACTQTDIKRVLAYSTMSQIGYMMFALGVSGYGGENGLGYTASLFHLFTHALFKALLFLGAGAVIHYVHSNELSKMGGLRKHIPITHITFLVACLAIAGVPPFSGFFSKEEILMASYQHNFPIYCIALFTAGLTAFYMFRLYFSIFWKKELSADSHAHGEGGFAMMFPLVLLALFTLGAGFIPFGKFISSDGLPLTSEVHLGFSLIPVLLSLCGIFMAMAFYKKESTLPDKAATVLGELYKASFNKFKIDEVWLKVTKGFLFGIVGRFAAWFDKSIINGAIDLGASFAEVVSDTVRMLQTGKVQDYAACVLAGVLSLCLYFLYVWM